MIIEKLAGLLRETEQHHGAYEKGHPKHDWWDWYAAYIHAREHGSTPEEATTVAGHYVDRLLTAAAR